MQLSENPKETPIGGRGVGDARIPKQYQLAAVLGMAQSNFSSFLDGIKGASIALAFRVAFGAYLFVHFAQLVPWGAELFSSRGVLPRSASPLLHLFPNVLALNDSPAAVNAFLVGETVVTFLAGGPEGRPELYGERFA